MSELAFNANGKTYARGDLLPLTILAEAKLAEAENTKPGNHLPGRYTHVVAGAGYRVRTPGNDSGFYSEAAENQPLDDVDRTFLDYLVEKAIESVCSLRRRR